jgi:hypothetical protein
LPRCEAENNEFVIVFLRYSLFATLGALWYPSMSLLQGYASDDVGTAVSEVSEAASSICRTPRLGVKVALQV